MRFKRILLTLFAVSAMTTVVSCDESNDEPTEVTGSGEANNQENSQDENQNIPPDNFDLSYCSAPKPGTVIKSGEVSVSSSLGKDESAAVIFNPVSGADSYNIYLDGKKLDDKGYYIQSSNGKLRADILGVKAGNHYVEIAAVKNGSESNAVKTKLLLGISAYDRSGYAHFKYDQGVGAYKDDGTLKDNAIVLYVTDENKNTVELNYNGKTVKGIGNILNSAGAACGEAGHETECKKVKDDKTYYGKGNTNQNILLDLAEDDVPLLVRFVGCVSNSGKYTPTTFDANSIPLIDGLTYYNSVDCGGSEDDNGHMARMKSGKNITFEGVGTDATIDGWGFHLICENAHKDLAKNFEVRNLRFINTPEDAIGMEGQETESTLTITASVERCWVHHNTFIAPKISSPAEGDKSEGDGSCDFKRGRYFTCSYNYFESCHKTNLVGSSKTSVQYDMSYHHNFWYQCESRQPLARKGNIHFYNNLVIGTTDTVSSLRADAYMFAENNYYAGCSRVVEYNAEGNTGICKAMNNVLIGCYNTNDANQVTDREASVGAKNCYDNAAQVDYNSFDTDPNLFYYDSSNKRSDCYLTSANQARLDCFLCSGSAFRTEANQATVKLLPNITDQAPTDTINGSKSLTIDKGKGILKVFSVTSPVTITISASSASGFDTAYVVKLDGSLVLAVSETEKSAVLENGTYAILSSVCFTTNAKNDKETLVTKCEFEPFDSEELNQKLLNNYNNAVLAIPSTIEYDEASYNAIKQAMDCYELLGDLKSQVNNYDVVKNAYNTYKSLGKTFVEGLISAIGEVTKYSGSAIALARSEYNSLNSKCPDLTISNYSTLVQAEASYESFAVAAAIEAIDAIGTVTLDSLPAIENAEAIYSNLDENQKALVTNYSKLTAAKTTYSKLSLIDNVQTSIDSIDLSIATVAEIKAVIETYEALDNDVKAEVNRSETISLFKKNITIRLIDAIGEVTNKSGAAISEARAAYNALSDSEKAEITNYNTLTEAEKLFATLVVEYEIIYDAKTETITAETGTTKAGFTYSSGDKSFLKIKNGKNYITLDNINATSATIVITSNAIDTSSAIKCCFTVTFTDGTTQDFTFDSEANKAESTNTIEISVSKEIKSISFVGSKEASKNVKVSYLSISYEK